MAKKELLIYCAIILVGFLDWLTTLIAIAFFGATETNPLLAGLTQSSIIIFSVVKMSAVTLTGLAFYKAEIQAKFSEQISPFAKRFLKSGCAITIIALTAFVANNLIAVSQVA